MDEMEKKELKEQQEVRFQIASHRVITMLDRKEIDYLDMLSRDALFSTGRKMSHNEVLKWLVDFAMEMEMDGQKIRSAEDFKTRLLDKVKERLLRQGYLKKEGSSNG